MRLITDYRQMLRTYRLNYTTHVGPARLLVLIPVLAITLLGTGCFRDTICVSGEGPIVSETRVTLEFSRVNLPDAFDAILVPDTAHFVVIEGQENLVDRMESSVSGETLTVRFPGCYRRAEPLRVYIHSPEFREIDLRGSGDLWSESLITAENFSLELTGSGDVDLDIEVDNALTTRVTGSGDIIQEGSASQVEYDIRGSGDIRGFGMLSVDADVEITGSGDCEVYASGELSVRITGSGSVYYKGSPVVTEVVITGSGSLINAD